MKVHSRIQLNLMNGETKFNSNVKRFDHLTLPVFWMEIVRLFNGFVGSFQIFTQSIILGNWRFDSTASLHPQHGVQSSACRSKRFHLSASACRLFMLGSRTYKFLLLYNFLWAIKHEVQFEEIDKVHSSLSLHQARDSKVWGKRTWIDSDCRKCLNSSKLFMGSNSEFPYQISLKTLQGRNQCDKLTLSNELIAN